MWTDDDRLAPRVPRWWRRLKTVDMDLALKLTLLTTSATLALGMATAVVQTVLHWVGF